MTYCNLLGIDVVHIPNEGKRSYQYAARLKRIGMQKGFPDLLFPYPRKNAHGLYIEMKRKGERKMITVFEFFMLLKTKQRIKFIRTTKDGQQMTVTGEAFRVMNSLMDVGCEMVKLFLLTNKTLNVFPNIVGVLAQEVELLRT